MVPGLDAIDPSSQPNTPRRRYSRQRAGRQRPLKDGYLGKVLAAKQSLAGNHQLAFVRLIPTIDQCAACIDRLGRARAARQQLLSQIGAAYAAGAVVILG
ncbi:MAG: hypothetical protein U0Z44_20200 [Kouleothrix sp.]